MGSAYCARLCRACKALQTPFWVRLCRHYTKSTVKLTISGADGCDAIIGGCDGGCDGCDATNFPKFSELFPKYFSSFSEVFRSFSEVFPKFFRSISAFLVVAHVGRSQLPSRRPFRSRRRTYCPNRRFPHLSLGFWRAKHNLGTPPVPNGP